MAFFMIFIACSKAESSDTMRGKLMLAWYQRAWTVSALEQSVDLHATPVQLLVAVPHPRCLYSVGSMNGT
jgi:hypothetical protein